MKFGLDEVVNNNHIILMDTSSLSAINKKRSAAKKDNHSNLTINLINTEIEYISGIITLLDKNNNLLVINEVLEEATDYLEILNRTYNLLKNSLYIRKFRRKKRLFPGVKEFKYYDIEETDFLKLNNFDLCTKNLSKLIKALRERITNSTDPSLVNKVKQMVCENPFIKGKELYNNGKFTDEKLVAAAYEKACKHEKVVLISRDRHFINLLKYSFHKKKIFEAPEKGYPILYFRPNVYRDYEIIRFPFV